MRSKETSSDQLGTAPGQAQLIAAIVEYSDDAIIGSTLSGIITSWNPAAERMYGYSSEEIVGRSGSLLTPSNRDGEFLASVAMVKDGRALEHFETTRLRKDGSEVPVSVTVAPIHGDDAKIVGASAIHRDVTQQRRAFEDAQRMEAIVQDSDDAIIGRTLGGIVTSWNPAAERMFGYAGTEIVGKAISPSYPRIEWPRVQPWSPRSGPVSTSSASKPPVHARTDRCSRPRSLSHRSATWTVGSSARQQSYGM